MSIQSEPSQTKREIVLSIPEKEIEVALASEGDELFILEMIKALADYEKSPDEATATEESLRQWLFVTPKAECLIASHKGIDRGIALFFTNFSTWEGIPGLFLEDLFVQEEARKCGIGIALFKALASIAHKREYTRIEWCCLDWNEPSLKFYKSLGAVARTEWVPHRLEAKEIESLAKSAE